MSMNGITPVFMRASDIRSGRVTNYEVCECIVDVVGFDGLEGRQQIGNLWRIYLANSDAKATIITGGINIQGQHMELFSDNPYVTGANSPNQKTTKVTIKDIPLSYSNNEIKETLIKLEVNIIGEIKYSYIRNGEGKLTSYKNGDRFVYVESKCLEKKPLPRYALCGIYRCRLSHYGQFANEKVKCNNCMGDDHPTWKCTSSRVCKACNKPDHQEGNEHCPAYEKLKNVIVIDSGSQILSNFARCTSEGTRRGIAY